MAKTIRYFDLIDETGRIVPVRVKTASANYMRKLVEDYKRLNKLSGEVRIREVTL